MATLPFAEHEHEPLVCDLLEAYRRCCKARRCAAEPCWAALDLTMSRLKALTLLALRGCMASCRPSAGNPIEQPVRLALVGHVDDVADRRQALATLSAHGYAPAPPTCQGGQGSTPTRLLHVSDEARDAPRNGLRAREHLIEAATRSPGKELARVL
jgi:hypothetical protein